MFTQFFGHYLLNNKLISPEQLKDALDYHHSAHIKLGVLAINSGYMTTEQVKKTHEAQFNQDKKFGELAIELGYLDKEKLDTLLSSQKHGHLLLGQALIDKNYMTLEQFEQALKNYKNNHSLTNEQFDAIQKNNIDEIVNVFYDFKDTSNKKVYANYFSLLFRNLIRFIDSNIRPENVTPIHTYKNSWIAYQEIKGEINLFTCVAAKEEAFISLGCKYANEQFSTADELTQASVGEFLNMNNGIFLVNMSNEGIELDMNPQMIEENKTFKYMKSAYCIPIHLPFGQIDFIISETNLNII